MRLIRADPGSALGAEGSVQTRVRPEMPLFSLTQAADDAVSHPRNTIVTEAACRAAGAPVERRLSPSGGNGFGTGRPGTPTVACPKPTRHG